MVNEVIEKRKAENQKWFKVTYYQMLANEREAKVREEWDKTWGAQSCRLAPSASTGALGLGTQPKPQSNYRIAPSSTGTIHHIDISEKNKASGGRKSLRTAPPPPPETLPKSLSSPDLKDETKDPVWLGRKPCPKTPRTPDVPGSPPRSPKPKPEWWMKRGKWTYSIRHGSKEQNAPFGGRSLEDNIAVFRTQFAGDQSRYEHGYLRYFKKRNPYGGFCLGITHGW